ARSNREDIVCDGLNKDASDYVLEEFHRYGIRSCWNGFYEDSSFYASARFNSELVVPHPAFGPSFPRPDWWMHPTRSNDLVHFRTTATLDPPDGSMWSYYLSAARLDFLVTTGSIFIGHYYPARIDSTNGFYDWKKEVWTIDPGFDAALERLDRLRDDGKLWLTTIDQFVSRSLAVESVVIRYVGDDRFAFTNTSMQDIKGLTVLFANDQVIQSGQGYKQGTKDGQPFISFDIKPGETISIDLSAK
ncbi:MAG: hypothetical protein ACKO1U_00365, partial [Bacteroidota bacterium]